MTRTPLLLLPAGALVVVVDLGAGCPTEVPTPGCGPNCPPPEPEEPPRLFVDPPFGLGYECVTIGCDSERRLVVENRGGGVVRLPLARLSVDTSADFTMRRADGGALPRDASEAVDVTPDAPLELIVRYAPSDGDADSGTVQLDWYDGAIEFVDAVVQHVELPLSTRVLGGVEATLAERRLNFGFVPVGGEALREIVVQNIGDGGVLEVGPVTLEDGTAPVFVEPVAGDWGTRFVNPGEEARIPVKFTPDAAAAFLGALLLPTNDGANPALRVEVAGTAIAEPRAQLSVTSLSFGDVRVGVARTENVLVTNLGGAALTFRPAVTSGAGLQVFPTDPQTIAPLESAAFAVAWTPATGGPFAGVVDVTSDDPTQPTISVLADGFANAPLLSASPASVDFGGVVQGWTTGAQTIQLSNAGFGELTISSIALEVGSSSQIILTDVPALPIKLSPGESPVSISVFMTASTLGTQSAVVLVGSDGVDGPQGSGGVTRVNVGGRVITCEQGCPVANGQPSCATGSCTIAACNQRFHDANNGFGDGCECGEDLVPGGGGARRDVDGACAGMDIGSLNDNSSPSSATFTGTLHDETDVDLFFFRARDNSQFLTDDYGARIEVLAAPPGLRVFARFVDAGGGCGGETQRSTNLSGGGNGVGDDSQDVTVWVEWAPGTAPVCGSYTIRMRADGG